VSGGDEDGLWGRERRLLTAGLVMTVTLTAAEALAVITVLPLVKNDLGGIRYYGWATSAFFLGTVMGVVVAGREADRRGLYAPFVSGLTLFAAGLVVCGSAASMVAFVAGRGVQGLGAGAIFSIAYVAIARAYPESVRPRVFAVLSTAWALPGMIGPGVAAVVAEHFGWRWVFIGLVPLVATAGLSTLPALRAIPARATAAASGTSILDAARITVATGLVLAAVSDPSWISLPLLLAGVAIGAGPVARLVPRAAGPLSIAVACGGLIMFSFFGTDTFVPLTITDARHRSTAVASIAVTAATLSWTAGAWAQARQLAHWPRRRLVGTGFALVVVGIGGVAASLSSAVPLAVAVVGWAVGGFGMGIGYSSVAVVVLAEAPPGSEGAATAAVQLAQNVGVALGAGVAGAAVAAGASAHWPPAGGLGVAFAITAVAGLFGIPLAGRLPRGTAADAAGGVVPAATLAAHD
jgi:MFS family permease